MPLHLLPKKSWNVYAPANIDRVKRDEAEARRKAIEQEKHSLQSEADDRLEILKQQSNTDRKSLKRKLPGEDDTDRDIRLALESASTPKSTSKEKQGQGSLTDKDGHFSLVSAPPPKRARADHEQEKDPYTVYLTDATGRGQQSNDTWYTSIQPQREKWGDHNPRRQERELARLNANDPLAAMKKGVKTLRENEKTRKEWMEQRERDLEGVERSAKERPNRRRKMRRDREDDDLKSLEDFNLDEGYTKSKVSRHSRDPNADLVTGHRHRDRKHGRHYRHRDRHGHATDTTSDRDRRHRRREEDDRAQPSRKELD